MQHNPDPYPREYHDQYDRPLQLTERGKFFLDIWDALCMFGCIALVIVLVVLFG